MNRIGEALHAHCSALFPICRSITGDGLRHTLRYVAERIPARVPRGADRHAGARLESRASGTPRDAWIATVRRHACVDFAGHNLHFCSTASRATRVVPLGELSAHLHTLPDQPDLIPYRTAYYAETWGFCLPHRRARAAAPTPAYRVVHRRRRSAHGNLTYGECVLPGDGGRTRC